MKTSQWINVALAYAVTVAASNLLLHVLGFSKPALVLIVGAVVATEVAAWSCRNAASPAVPRSVKITLGILLLCLCLVVGLLLQVLFRWTDHPAITLPIGAVGSAVLPLVTFDTFRKSFRARRK